jgi:hypothetical protein
MAADDEAPPKGLPSWRAAYAVVLLWLAIDVGLFAWVSWATR